MVVYHIGHIVSAYKRGIHMLERYRITKDCRTQNYVILDRLKLGSVIRDKRLTKFFFETREMAEGFLFGRAGKLSVRA